jgi:chromosome segregation ATPase
MSFKTTEPQTAEQRFRQAFERLKANDPTILEPGTPVTQNNIAKEAGCDPSALRKSRFPALIREIQAYVELHKDERPSQRQADLKQRKARRSLQERLDDALRQRDAAQSLILSANRRIIELSDQVQSLQRRLDEFQSPPAHIRKK